MRKLGFLFALFFIVAAVSTNTYAQEQQEKNEITSGQAKKGDKSRGEDPNIKVKERKNVKGDQETMAIRPPEKGADPTARGAASYCKAAVDNHTNWYLDVYIDGYYEGHVSPWGYGSVYVGAGNTKQYVVAEFNDGSRVWWGPSTKNCYNETVEMDIYEDYYYQSLK